MKTTRPVPSSSDSGWPKAGMAGIWSLLTVAALGSMTYISATLSNTSMSIANQNKAELIAGGEADITTGLAMIQIEKALQDGLQVPIAGTIFRSGSTETYTTLVLAGPNVLTHESTDLPVCVTVIGVESSSTVDETTVTSRRVAKITQAATTSGKLELVSIEETGW